MSFRILAWLGLDATNFDKGMKDSENKVKTFSEKMASLISGGPGGALKAGAGALGLGAVFYEANKMIDELQDRAKEINLGTALTNLDADTFQRVKNVVDARGGSVEQVAGALEHLAAAQEKVKGGGEEGQKLAKAFQALGVSGAEITKNDYRKLFFDISDGLKNTAINAEKLVAIKELLGKGGVGLMPSLKEGFDGGLASRSLLDENDLKQIKELKDLQMEGKAIWQPFMQELGIRASQMATGALTLPSSFMYVMKDLLSGGQATKSDGAERYASQKLQGEKAQIAARERARDEEQAAAAAAAAADDKEFKERTKRIGEATKREEEAADKAEKAAKFQALSKQDQIKALQEETAALKQRNNEIDREIALYGDADNQKKFARAKNRNQIAQNEQSLQTLSKSGGFRETLHFDALAQIGGFTGNSGRTTRLFEDQILTAAKATAQYTGRIAQKMED